MDAWKSTNSTWGGLTKVTDFKEQLSYDANGNILTYLRNGTGSTLSLNNYNYTYTANTNRLASITNSVNSTTGTYSYDAIGNAIKDDKQNVNNAVWNVYGKLQSVTKTNGVQISYTYNTGGNRILKKVTDTTEAYVYDASGNIMSVYKQAGASARVLQTELTLYGSKRIGTVNSKAVPDSNITLVGGFGLGVKSVFTRGEKEYLLSDHRENTIASITDRRQQFSTGGINVDFYIADVRTASYYSAFGAISNAYNADTIKYAFNGQRRSIEISSTAQTALYWEYNGDVGRRWNLDPMADNGHNIPISPYAAMANNSIFNIDPDGLDFSKSIESSYTLGAPRVLHDLGNTNYSQKKWYGVSFNKKTNEFDIKLNYTVAYSKFFKVPYDNNGTKMTLDGENPGLFKQVKAHEYGHVDQMFEQASEAKLSVTFEFGGLKKTYKGHADDILTNIYKDYKKAGKVEGMEDFQKSVLPWAESAVIGEFSKVLGKPYPDAEADANKRAEQTNGKPKYVVVDDHNNSNVKFKGKTLKATQNE